MARSRRNLCGSVSVELKLGRFLHSLAGDPLFRRVGGIVSPRDSNQNLVPECLHDRRFDVSVYDQTFADASFNFPHRDFAFLREVLAKETTGRILTRACALDKVRAHPKFRIAFFRRSRLDTMISAAQFARPITFRATGISRLAQRELNHHGTT